jgi:hypothetical protein
MLLHRVYHNGIQTHPLENDKPNRIGNVAMKENMVNGFFMIEAYHIPSLQIVSNNSFAEKCLPIW